MLDIGSMESMACGWHWELFRRQSYYYLTGHYLNNMKETLNKLVKEGQMVGFDENGDLVSVQELLSRLKGREITPSEALAYVLRHRDLTAQKQRIEHFMAYAKRKKLSTAINTHIMV